MNLLELMLKEEVEWPVGACVAVQDYDREMKFGSSDVPLMAESGKVWIDGGFTKGLACASLADDWQTRIITREEYKAAGGWMVIDTESAPPSFMIEIGKDGRCYRAINQQTVQLDNPEMESDFEPFVSVEDTHECKAEHAATSKQSAPKGSGNPILGMVLADLTNRALEGKEKYGEPLKARNGRNALWDAYQEALDLAMYLRQLIQEQQDA